MDKETIIKGCEYWVNNHKDETLPLAYSSVVELLDVLKEQEAEIQQLRLALDITKCHLSILSSGNHQFKEFIKGAESE